MQRFRNAVFERVPGRGSPAVRQAMLTSSAGSVKLSRRLFEALAKFSKTSFKFRMS